MRKIILALHCSVDGFVAGPNGEMDWIKFDDDLFGFIGGITEEADTALYGRVTYQMMDSYWPTAGDQPYATKHDKEHSAWYNKVNKVVLSKTMDGNGKDKTTFISDHVYEQISSLKKQDGKNILIFGSPGASHQLMELNLIDEYWLFINPIILGQGIPYFSNISNQVNLQPGTSRSFPCGVTALNFAVDQ